LACTTVVERLAMPEDRTDFFIIAEAIVDEMFD
jgi:predicted transcriptional regulator